MDREALTNLIREKMNPAYYQLPGATLYSSPSTLRRSPVYIMGLNPAGDPHVYRVPIIDTQFPAEGKCAYTAECWQPKCHNPVGSCPHVDENGFVLDSALTRHQRNMILLARALGERPENLFSANALFGRSSSLVDLRGQTHYTVTQWWDACWPVHQAFLSIVRPRMIVSLGYGVASSAFGLLWRTSGRPNWRQLGEKSRRGGWVFDANIPLGNDEFLQSYVVGVPHPSYMPIGPVLGEKLREVADGSLVP